jgi:hypothetical protein
MTASRSKSSYELLTAARPRLFGRPADIGAVSLLGQAVSDVLDDDKSDAIVLQLIADLESARSSAIAEVINEQWALPLTALLGLLRQHLHNSAVAAESLNPSSLTLRDKVLSALDAGIDTPVAIGEYVGSPTTVVSRVLRQLAQEGRVEQAGRIEDKRRRPYRRTTAQAEVNISAPQEDPPLSSDFTDTSALVEFANEQIRVNVQTAKKLLPDLIAIGSNSRVETETRVSALSVAGVITRAAGAPTAGEDALDLAETAEVIAQRSGCDLLRARAAYDRARAYLFVHPRQSDRYVRDLKRAEKYARRLSGPEAQIRLGWCAYTHCLIEDGKDLTRARGHAEDAVQLFEEADFHYGQAAALTMLTRSRYAHGDWEGTDALAQRALSIARSHGYLRIVAESSFWAAELQSAQRFEVAEHLFTAAAEHFESVGSRHWRALSEASLEVAKAQCGDRNLEPKDAERLLSKLLKLQKRMSNHEQSWAAAVFKRRIATCARWAGEFDLAKQEFCESKELYAAAADARGLAMAQAGLLASEREHDVVREEDKDDALRGERSAFGSATAPQAARDALELFDEPCEELAYAL